jgi:hypothetical protein
MRIVIVSIKTKSGWIMSSSRSECLNFLLLNEIQSAGTLRRSSKNYCERSHYNRVWNECVEDLIRVARVKSVQTAAIKSSCASMSPSTNTFLELRKNKIFQYFSLLFWFCCSFLHFTEFVFLKPWIELCVQNPKKNGRKKTEENKERDSKTVMPVLT